MSAHGRLEATDDDVSYFAAAAEQRARERERASRNMSKMRHAVQNEVFVQGETSDRWNTMNFMILDEAYDRKNSTKRRDAVEALLLTQGMSHYFRGFTSTEMEELCSKFLSVLLLKVGQCLFRRGEPATFVAIVLSGSLEVTPAQGLEARFKLYRGAMVGEVGCFDPMRHGIPRVTVSRVTR